MLLASITGVVHYLQGAFTVLPRTSSELVFGVPPSPAPPEAPNPPVQAAPKTVSGEVNADPWNSLSETDVDRFRAIRFDEEKGVLVKDDSLLLTLSMFPLFFVCLGMLLFAFEP